MSLPSRGSLLLALFLLSTSCQAPAKTAGKTSVQPLRLDLRALSGLGLRAVKDAKQPDRELFQTRLFRGRDISVYVVATQTMSVEHERYGIEEFLYMLNGRARMRPQGHGDIFVHTGEFGVAPKGYAGVWETQAGESYLCELSVISTKRSKAARSADIVPRKFDAALLSGIGIEKDPGATSGERRYRDVLYKGAELEVQVRAETPGERDVVADMPEQLLYVLAGSLELAAVGGEAQTFYRGDFVVLPAGFRGSWRTRGHSLFRSLHVMKA